MTDFFWRKAALQNAKSAESKSNAIKPRRKTRLVPETGGYRRSAQELWGVAGRAISKSVNPA
jgi:hypothetical protein